MGGTDKKPAAASDTQDITGTYDALILARFKKRAKLSEMIKNVIHASPYVERSNTHIVLNVIKEKGSFAELINKE